MNVRTDRLRECREQSGLSKLEVSRRTGLSQPAYVRYENGTRKPSMQVVKEIARVLDTSPDYLMGLSDDSAINSIEVRKEDDPKLFCIVEEWPELGRVGQNRLFAYYKKLTDI